MSQDIFFKELNKDLNKDMNKEMNKDVNRSLDDFKYVKPKARTRVIPKLQQTKFNSKNNNNAYELNYNIMNNSRNIIFHYSFTFYYNPFRMGIDLMGNHDCYWRSYYSYCINRNCR